MTHVCLNAYALRDADALTWPVRRYSVNRVDGLALTHEHRGMAKDATYELRRQHSAHCRGWGFVIDPNERTIVVPSIWQIPTNAEANGLRLRLEDEFTARADAPEHESIVSGILREGLKKHIKQNPFREWGPLWQDFNRFCRQPQFQVGERFAVCRSFYLQAKRLAGGHWAILIPISTTVVDGYSLADYFSRGEVADLADALEWRRTAYSRRDASPADVRAYVHNSGNTRIVAIDDPQALEQHRSLGPQDQQRHVLASIPCHEFKQPSEQIPANALHLIVDTQQTEELHSDTIIEPAERAGLTQVIREHLNRADLYGSTLTLDETLWDASADAILIGPPAVRVKAARGTTVIRCAQPVSSRTLHERSRRRRDHVNQYGFLMTRPMRPLIAVHDQLGPERARRLHADATEILRQHGVGNVNFEFVLYSDLTGLRRHVERGHYDALIAVLPPDNDAAGDLHERIKRGIEVPSQCMQARNVMPKSWAVRPAHEFHRSEPRQARRFQNRLEAVVLNLLVKHNWVPFAPAEAFHYNVHVGLDVGGLHNTNAMACVGYGFSDPGSDLLFHLREIPIRGQKKEPIPTGALQSGLVELFEHIAGTLQEAGVMPDFSRVLFYRDGALLGRADEWNEQDALLELHRVLAARGWIRTSALWTVVEVMKEAEGMRVFEMSPEATNPTVGRCTFPFNDPNLALVNSTGVPYLPQGTASPLKVRMVDLLGHGEFRDVLQDLIWQCDLGFTKPDMGFSLPWVLHVADTGALQISRSYKITGIAA
jgi:hypothetical protein